MTKIGFLILAILLIGKGTVSFFDKSLQFQGIDGRLVFGPFGILAGSLLLYYAFRQKKK